MDPVPDIYPLTSLQIGDIQSSQSQAFLHFAPSSNRILFLIDNRPWSWSTPSKSTQLWQLLVTKYRVSPFINTRTLTEDSDCGRNDCPVLKSGKLKRIGRLLSVIDAVEWQKKLSRALHGFIVFDVAWRDVHGIQYLNELQAETSLALEVRFMKKWEFKNAEEALSRMSSWFSGTSSETHTLMHNLRKLAGLNISNFITQTSSKDMSCRGAFLFQSLPEDMFYDAEDSFHDTVEKLSDEPPMSLGIKDYSIHDEDHGSGTPEVDCVEMEKKISKPIQYINTLLLVRFNDCILPFKLRKVIMSDLGLLRKLESGLPSWVIFLQSYPLFCNFYRPWMRHLARTLYILISFSTFIIAFYDLYKNVPLLKAAVSKFCGPFFDWIDKWDMISRIRYLGTMLFLQNFEKMVQWFMIMMRTMRPVFEVATRPLMGALAGLVKLVSPVWNACAEVGEFLLSILSFAMESMYDIYLIIVGVLCYPIESLYSYLWVVVIFLSSIISLVMNLFLVPLRCVSTLVDYALLVCLNIYDMINDVWSSAIMPLLNLSKAAKGASSVSIWRELWNDIFKQVFGAIRGVVNGFMVFFVACNRHRLSIYNHIRAFLWRLAFVLRIGPRKCLCRQLSQEFSKVKFSGIIHISKNCRRSRASIN